MRNVFVAGVRRLAARWSTGLAVLLLCSWGAATQAAPWLPSRPVTFVVTGGSGGGADQMARLIQGIVAKYHLMDHPMVVVIENGGGGAQGVLDGLCARGESRARQGVQDGRRRIQA
jgi:tripartite-type tricarboxylate transporter receptor subunit TctC